MTWLLAFGVAGVFTLVVVMWRIGASPSALLDIPWPLAVILGSLFGGGVLHALVIGEPIEPNTIGSLAFLAAIVGVFTFASSFLVCYAQRKLEE